MIAGLAFAVMGCSALAVAAGTRRGQQTAIGHILMDILLSLRFVLWEKPLRAITGRRRPDYTRIKTLQRAADVPLADLVAKAGRDAEREHAPSLIHGTKASGLSFANAEIAAASALVSAGYDLADVLAAVGQELIRQFAALGGDVVNVEVELTVPVRRAIP